MYQKLSENFAKVKDKRPKDVCEFIGGKVKQNNFSNVCAVRMSYAFNKAGIKIPYIKDETVSVPNNPNNPNNDKKDWYIFRVRVFKQFLKDKKYNYIASDKKNKLKPFKGKKGVIVFDCSFTNATGHVDLFNGSYVEGTDYSESSQLNSLGLYEIN